MRIVWIDDEITKYDNQIMTLELYGHVITRVQRTSEFIQWYQKSNDADVDAFFVDLMMKIDDDSQSFFKEHLNEKFIEDNDTGILIIRLIRDKFKNKPIIGLTVVNNPPEFLFKEDNRITFMHKMARIKPALDRASALMENS